MLIHHTRAWWRRSDDYLLVDEEHAGSGQARDILMETCKSMTADDFYQQGNDYRRKGDWQHAIDCYLEAISLDPLSPAVEAKQMLDSILGFYCKDMYNP